MRAARPAKRQEQKSQREDCLEWEQENSLLGCPESESESLSDESVSEESSSLLVFFGVGVSRTGGGGGGDAFGGAKRTASQRDVPENE